MDTRNPQDDLQRFTQLAQRSFRVKISVLLLLLASLFLVWSALTSGTQKAEQVDRSFCQQIVKDPYYAAKNLFTEYSCGLNVFVQSSIEQARHTHDNDAPYPSTMSAGEQLKHIQESLEHTQQFQDHDWNRREAYHIEISLPYAKSAVSLNGAFISAIWPFGALLGLSIAVALGFKQSCYEILLSAIVASLRPKEVHGINVALTEFLAGELSENDIDGEHLFLYKKPLGLFPETVVSGALFICVSLLCLNLLTDYAPQFTERGKEFFSDSYYLWLYLFAVALFFLLLRTRRFWRSSLRDALGGDVKSSRLFFLHKLFRYSPPDLIGPALFYLSAGVCLGSLFLRWQDAYRGFVLLCCPKQIIDDMPIAARIVQAQMILVVAFVGATVLLRLKRHIRPNWLQYILQSVQGLGAYYVLLLIGFIEFYRMIGAYGFFKDYYAWPMVGNVSPEAFSNLANLPIIEGGSLTRGPLLFLVSCQTLALAEIWLRAKRKLGHHA
jgi:hypothetical protein